MAGFQIDDAIMREVVSSAILKAMTAESRETLVQQAIAGLLSPESNSSYDKRSKLQKLFEEAAYDVARDEVKVALTADARVKGALREMVAKALEHALEKDEDLVSNLASAMSASFAKASRY